MKTPETTTNLSITLDYPIESDGTKMTSITMRRPKSRDLYLAQKSSKDDIEQTLHILSSLTTLSKDDLLALDLIDYGKLQKELNHFLEAAGMISPAKP